MTEYKKYMELALDEWRGAQNNSDKEKYESAISFSLVGIKKIRRSNS